MEIAEIIHEMAVKARVAAAELRKLTTEEKNAMLLKIADALEAAKPAIDAANAEDVAVAKENGLSPAMVDRLTLTDSRFKSMVDGVRHIATLPDPVGEELWTRERPSGITIKKVRVPFGVVCVVFESRPNVFIDTAALCLKTGNAVILRGGKEAIETNKALYRTVAALGDWRWQPEAGQVNVVHVSSFARNRKFLSIKRDTGARPRGNHVAHSLFVFFSGLFPVPLLWRG